MQSDKKTERQALEDLLEETIAALESRVPELWERFNQIGESLAELESDALPGDLSHFTKIEPAIIRVLTDAGRAMRQVEIRRALEERGYAIDRSNRLVVIRGGVSNKFRTPPKSLRKEGLLLGLSDWDSSYFKEK